MSRKRPIKPVCQYVIERPITRRKNQYKTTTQAAKSLYEHTTMIWHDFLFVHNYWLSSMKKTIVQKPR